MNTTYGAANAVTAVTPAEEPIAPDTFAHLNGYLDNLAAAATTEKTTLAQLIENNATLTASITSITASVASLTTAYTILATGSDKPHNTPTTNTAGTGSKQEYASALVHCGQRILLDARLLSLQGA